MKEYLLYFMKECLLGSIGFYKRVLTGFYEGVFV